MEIYLVGGAVRDELLGRSVGDRDWVVVGARVEDMLALGYRQVGRDFPVFLHPETNEEYALARTERKTGPGHQGFAVHADPDVSLEDDLIRRDLTINAMARAADGELIDPYNGRADLDNRCLRHVSEAFAEDPLRVFRVARFAAQLPNFTVAEATSALMTAMAAAGSLEELSAERVWGELAKALSAPLPLRFLEVLAAADALSPWLKEFEGLTPQVPKVLEKPAERYAAFCNELSGDALATFGARLKVPQYHQRLAGWVQRHGPLIARWPSAEPAALYQALQDCRALRSETELEAGLRVVEALHEVDCSRLIDVSAALVDAVSVPELQARGLQGPDLGRALDEGRIQALAALQREA